MRSFTAVGLTALAVLCLASFWSPTAVSGHAQAPAPHFVAGPAVASSALPAAAPAAAPASVVHPAIAPGLCPTPSITPNWDSTNFFADALVTFDVPNQPTLSGSNFQMTPCPNVIPTYTNGFWMNVTTNVPLVSANVTIWGTGWPTPSNAGPPIANFDPTTPSTRPMQLLGPYYHTARFYFNVYKFFWPGSQVYFNITLSTVSASPGVIRSSQTHYNPINFSGGVNNATWSFYVADPWGAGQIQSADTNFSNDIQVSTSPSVLGDPAYEPNERQSLQILLTSVNPTGGPTTPIPMAQGTFTLTGGEVGSGVYIENFGPSNHTVLTLPLPLGPYPGSTVQFNITAWLPWEQSTNGAVGAIDRIYSPLFKFNWSKAGGWWAPTQGLGSNVQMTTTPDVTSATTSSSVLQTGTPVNITIHSPIENVTITSAVVNFAFSDSDGQSSGTILMGAVNQNTSYAVLPGLPPSSTMTFSVTAKDVFGNPVSSGNYSYKESGAASLSLAAGYGLFFVDVLDISTGNLVPHVNYTIGNNSWTESGTGNIYGFLAPVPIGGVGYLPVAFGTYTVTVKAFGVTETYSFVVSTSNPFTVLFLFASQAVPPDTSVNAPPAVALPAVIGLAGAFVASFPIVNWFRERRRKAEAEQRRITL